MPRRMEYELAVDIDAPPDVVWSVMSDVERWSEWTDSITSIERLDAGPFAVGSLARVRQPKLAPAVYRVTELTEGRSFTWEMRSLGAHGVGRHVVEPRGPGGSRAILGVTARGFLVSLLGGWMSRITREYVGMEAAGLKRRSEERAAKA
jgi:hypothetical protein